VDHLIKGALIQGVTNFWNNQEVQIWVFPSGAAQLRLLHDWDWWGLQLKIIGGHWEPNNAWSEVVDSQSDTIPKGPQLLIFATHHLRCRFGCF